MMTVLGFTQEGVMCMLMRGEKWTPMIDNMEEAYRATQAWNDTFICDERVQIGGIAFIMDFEGMRKRDLMKMQDMQASKMGTMYFQVGCTPHDHPGCSIDLITLMIQVLC
ncbi:unnamed protein product [Dibothriocephalus latus]|uniref:CRAL-TRIO domain-containing protein n=1 Tax=Dibothriocephalus latus TaxID=60516 RepID=A0A3P6QFQ7_DIBLA|nr:unnamed protein product [Dibothriocephalus latus]